MGSVGNPNPWAPYDTYKDCSQGICSIYCPQWCYIFPPPPPSFFEDDDEGSSTDFSPLLIALIGILASAFILVSYYTIISKFCHRRRGHPSTAENTGRNPDQSMGEAWQGNTNPTAGLDEALIKSITVYKYKKNEGFVDCTDCSVCLSEFEENESLRLLPKCNHAFHVPCIDTWLKSHSNCPLCRANIATVSNTSSCTSAAVPNQPIPAASITAGGNRSTEINVSALEYQHRSDDSVLVIQDLETGARDEAVVSVTVGDGDMAPPKPPETQPFRRSVSLNSSLCQGAVSIADILREIEDDDEESIGIGTSRWREDESEGGEEMCGKTTNQRNGVSSFLIRSSLAMKRSVSTGRFIFTRYDRGRNCTLPN